MAGLPCGGIAFAAGRNSVDSRDIINGQVRAADVATGAITAEKIASGAVDGTKIADESLDETDVLESSLELGASWHEVGTAGEPAFEDVSFCNWRNVGGGHDTGAFMRDRSGTVHLKGWVRSTDPELFCNMDSVPDVRIFKLPPGFRPLVRNVFPTLSSAGLARVNVDGPGRGGQPAGAVSLESVDKAATEGGVSLDGISFRCAPSGVDGCP